MKHDIYDADAVPADAAPADPEAVAEALEDEPNLYPGWEEVSNLRYGIADTTFAVLDMGDMAEKQLRSMHRIPPGQILRRTVPGFKDLGVAARQLLDVDGCDIVIACAMVGAEDIDKQCAQDASFGLQMCQQFTGKHVLEVFVHMDETDDPKELRKVTENRVQEHATNAYWLLEAPDELRQRAGTGQRQGFEDVGPLRE